MVKRTFIGYITFHMPLENKYSLDIQRGGNYNIIHNLTHKATVFGILPYIRNEIFSCNFFYQRHSVYITFIPNYWTTIFIEIPENKLISFFLGCILPPVLSLKIR